MNKTLKLAALTLALCAAAAYAEEPQGAKPQPGSEAVAEGRPGGPEQGAPEDRQGPPKMFGEKMKAELGLSDEQFKKLEENRAANMKKMAGLRKELREQRKAFDEELGKGGNEAKLKKIHASTKEVAAKMADAMFDGMLAVRKVLTPEQLEKFHKMIKRDGPPGMKGRHGKGGQGGMPGMKDGNGRPGRGCDCPCMKDGRMPPPPGMEGGMMPPDMMDEEGEDAPPAKAAPQAREKK